MGSGTHTDLERRHGSLRSERSQLRQQRRQFVQRRTRELSDSHEDISGSFSTTAIQEVDNISPLGESRSPERTAAMKEILDLVASSEEYQRLSTELSEVNKALDEVWNQAATIIVDDDLTKKKNIAQIWAVFGEDVPNRRVAAAVGCHDQYPGRLVFDPETETAEYKDHVKKRKRNQVRTEQRAEILERDDHACVRCGTGDESLTIHHIDPVNTDGPAARSNLATLCDSCHSEAHDARGAGAVIYETTDGFWAWVRDGSRGFDPHQSTLADF